MLVLTDAKLATFEELFQFKESGFELPPFPGYTNDQWGIKAHNRPWIANVGQFSKGQKIAEVGGAYSTLPKYLSQKHELEAWIIDDFGKSTGEEAWSRWGDPAEVAAKNLDVHYEFEILGIFSPRIPSDYFDRIFSVSTLEHIPWEFHVDVFRDMHRCLAKGGKAFHTIDIPAGCWKTVAVHSVADYLPISRFDKLQPIMPHIRHWISVIKRSGVKIKARTPRSICLFNREILVESPDVVFRFHPPNNKPKKYLPSASLLITIDDL